MEGDNLLEKTLTTFLSDEVKKRLQRKWSNSLKKEQFDGGQNALKQLKELFKNIIPLFLDFLETSDKSALQRSAMEISSSLVSSGIKLSDALQTLQLCKGVILDELPKEDKKFLLDAIKKVDEGYSDFEFLLVRNYLHHEKERVERDIRSVSQYQEELKILRRRMEEIERTGKAVGAMGVELLLLDNKKRIIWANTAVKERYNEKGGLEGWTCGQVRDVPVGVCEDCPTSWAIRNKQLERGIISVSRESGRWFYEVTAFPVIGENGEVEQVFEMIQDVTLRVKAGDEKRQSEEYYRILFEHSGAAVCVLEPDKTISRTNRRFCQMTGYARHEIEGKMSFLDLVAEGERPRMARYHELRRINPSSVPGSYDFTFVNRSGEERRANVTVGLVPGTMQSICSIRDITEEEQTKEYLEAILHDSADAIIGLDAEDRIISWNIGAEQLFGYKESEVIGRHFQLLVPPDLIESGELQKIGEETRKKGFLKNYETERITKDGRRIKVNLTRSVLKDKLGKFRGTSAIIRDVTEQKALEQQVIHAEKLAAIGQLTAGLAHEMGTPLNIISGRAEYLLSDMSPDDPRRESLNVIISQTERMAQLINNLLEFSRPQKVHFAKLEVPEVVEGVLSLLEAQLMKSKIQVDFQKSDDLPKVEADYNQLQQVFLNIILNAIQAMPNGGRLELKLEPDSNETIKAVISDTGVGIPPENLPKIFEPFFTTKDSGQGTGLGLAIVAKILRDHGGSVEVWSEPGKGATFTIRLPITHPMLD